MYFIMYLLLIWIGFFIFQFSILMLVYIFIT